MPRRFFKAISPSADKIRDSHLVHVFGEVLHEPNLWHLHRHTVSTAFFIGIFCAFLPIPGQMFVAGGMAILMRCHLPIAVTLVWITNPLTMPFVYFSSYKLGTFLLGHRQMHLSDTVSWQSLIENVEYIWQPLLLGSIVAGFFFGSLSYAIVRVSWRLLVVQRWRKRASQRTQR